MGSVGSVLSGIGGAAPSGAASGAAQPAPYGAAKGGAGSRNPGARDHTQVRLVCFDFDCTMSVIHMFKQIAGWEKPNQLDPPYAQSEKGQIAKIRELNRQQWAVRKFPAPSLTIEPNGSSFSSALLGGDQRVQNLQAMLEHMHRCEAEAVIITKGYVGAVQQVMHDVGLLQYFAAVYGLTGSTYGTTGYDMEVQKFEFGVEGKPEQEYTSKSSVIRQIAQLRQLSPEEILFVDDDPAEVRGVAKARCAKTLHVADHRGMTTEDLQTVCDVTQR